MFGMLFMMGILAPLESSNVYLDPGSGSLILQIILATVLGGLVIIRTFWTKIKDAVTGLFNKQSAENEDDLNG